MYIYLLLLFFFWGGLGAGPTQEFGGKEISRKEGKYCYLIFLYMQFVPYKFI
jgi:K+-transporting ATPase A subunit